MASIEESLVTLFKGETTIANLLGGANMRYTPDNIPQGATLPAVAYQRINTERANTLATIGTLERTPIQLTIWANNPAQRASVKSAFISFVRRVNLEWKEQTRNRVIGGVRFGGILVETDIDQREPASNVYQSIVDLVIWANVLS